MHQVNEKYGTKRHVRRIAGEAHQANRYESSNKDEHCQYHKIIIEWTMIVSLQIFIRCVVNVNALQF